MSSLKESANEMSKPIAILGAGIAGLTLGRCLRQKGISSVIFDRASSTPRHSYGITLEPQAYKPLLDVLNIDEHTFRSRLAVDSMNEDGGTGKVSASDCKNSSDIRVNRSKLESMLREGQTIQTEHVLSSASVIGSTGWVELRWEHGGLQRVSQVVDALGVHSPLRKSLVPDAQPEVQPFAVFSGKRYLKNDNFRSIYAQAFGDGNMLVRNPKAKNEPRLEISLNEHKPNGTTSISYIYSRAARDDENSTDPLHRPDRPNAGATDIPEELYNELNNLVVSRDLKQPFRECFDANQIRNERVLHWLMRTIMVPKQDLLRFLQHGIVMIGDAAHAVPILGGHGANMAILDAIKLADALADQRNEVRALESFYENEWQGWNDAVEQSKKQLVEMHRGSSSETSTANL